MFDNVSSISNDSRHSQIFRHILNVDQHRVLAHVQLVPLQQVLDQALVQHLNVTVQVVDNHLQLCDVHVRQDLSGHSSLLRRQHHTHLLHTVPNQLRDWRLTLSLAFHLIIIVRIVVVSQ